MASTLIFKLVTVDGAPADPPSLTTIVALWRAGDTIPLRHGRCVWSTYRQTDPDEPPALVVEDMSG